MCLCVCQSQMRDMEAEIAGLQKEKEELNNALLSAKATANSSKSVLLTFCVPALSM